jgi:hypothetical protein
MLSQQVTTRSFQKKDGFLTISHRLYSILLLAVFCTLNLANPTSLPHYPPATYKNTNHLC